MNLQRINPNGLRYSLTDYPNKSKTVITSHGKSITVNFPLEQISQSWFNWQMCGELIQKAFPYLNPDEREFLITGLTPEEWNKLFPKED